MNHGGKRANAGRKSKADEERIKGLSINAMKSIFGSEEKAFEHIAKLAKDSFPHLRLLMEYAYGKPTNSMNLGFEENSNEKPVIEIRRTLVTRTENKSVS